MQNSNDILCGPLESCGGIVRGERGLGLAQFWSSYKDFKLNLKNKGASLESSEQWSNFRKWSLIAECKTNCRGGV